MRQSGGGKMEGPMEGPCRRGGKEVALANWWRMMKLYL
jgi:hypothetical protein